MSPRKKGRWRNPEWNLQGPPKWFCTETRSSFLIRKVNFMFPINLFSCLRAECGRERKRNGRIYDAVCSTRKVSSSQQFQTRKIFAFLVVSTHRVKFAKLRAMVISKLFQKKIVWWAKCNFGNTQSQPCDSRSLWTKIAFMSSSQKQHLTPVAHHLVLFCRSDINVLQEGTETLRFWNTIGGKEKYYTEPRKEVRTGKTPRFIATNKTGIMKQNHFCVDLEQVYFSMHLFPINIHTCMVVQGRWHHEVDPLSRSTGFAENTTPSIPLLKRFRKVPSRGSFRLHPRSMYSHVQFRI